MGNPKAKQFKFDIQTEQRLIALAQTDERSQSGEVRWLIACEWARRQGEQSPCTPSQPLLPQMTTTMPEAQE